MDICDNASPLSSVTGELAAGDSDRGRDRASKKHETDRHNEPVLIFDDISGNGRSIVDLRGTEQDVLARLPPSALDPRTVGG